MVTSEMDSSALAVSCPASGIDEAAERLYCAEVALHAAFSSHIDEWISAAYEHLHLAVAAHRAAMLETAS